MISIFADILGKFFDWVLRHIVLVIFIALAALFSNYFLPAVTVMTIWFFNQFLWTLFPYSSILFIHQAFYIVVSIAIFLLFIGHHNAPHA